MSHKNRGHERKVLRQTNRLFRRGHFKQYTKFDMRRSWADINRRNADVVRYVRRNLVGNVVVSCNNRSGKIVSISQGGTVTLDDGSKHIYPECIELPEGVPYTR